MQWNPANYPLQSSSSAGSVWPSFLYFAAESRSQLKPGSVRTRVAAALANFSHISCRYWCDALASAKFRARYAQDHSLLENEELRYALVGWCFWFLVPDLVSDSWIREWLASWVGPFRPLYQWAFLVPSQEGSARQDWLMQALILPIQACKPHWRL